MTCRAGHVSCLSMLFVIPSSALCHSDDLCHSERSEESGAESLGRAPERCSRSFTPPPAPSMVARNLEPEYRNRHQKQKKHNGT